MLWFDVELIIITTEDAELLDVSVLWFDVELIIITT